MYPPTYKINVQRVPADGVAVTYYREDQPDKVQFATIEVDKVSIFIDRIPEGIATARAIRAAAQEILDRYDPQPEPEQLLERPMPHWVRDIATAGENPDEIDVDAIHDHVEPPEDAPSADAALVDTASPDAPTPLSIQLAVAGIRPDIDDCIYRDPTGGLWRYCGAGVHPAASDGTIIHATVCQGFSKVSAEHGTLTLIWISGKPVTS